MCKCCMNSERNVSSSHLVCQLCSLFNRWVWQRERCQKSPKKVSRWDNPEQNLWVSGYQNQFFWNGTFYWALRTKKIPNVSKQMFAYMFLLSIILCLRFLWLIWYRRIWSSSRRKRHQCLFRGPNWAKYVIWCKSNSLECKLMRLL